MQKAAKNEEGMIDYEGIDKSLHLFYSIYIFIKLYTPQYTFIFIKMNIEEYISFAANKIYAAHSLICSIF